MRKQSVLELSLSVFTFFWVVLSIFYFLFLIPYTGFNYSNTNGEVLELFFPQLGEQSLRVGDRILKINHQDFETTFSGLDFQPPVFSSYRPGDMIPLTIVRDGQQIDILQPFGGPSREEFLTRVGGQWLIPILFWLAGAITLLFVRPRTQVSFLMALFFYLTAIWISAGVVSSGHVVWAALSMRVAIWLTIPVYWHFLWSFPVPLGKLPRALPGALYGLGLGLAAAQAANLLPSSLYLIGFILALVGSLSLIVLHVIRQRSERANLAGLLIAVAIILVPMIVTSVLFSFAPASSFGIVAVTGFSALPGYFFFILIRRQVTGQIRTVNRFMRIYLIAIFVEMVASFLPVLVLDMGFHLDIRASLLIASVLVLFTMLIGFTPFLILPALARAEMILPVDGKNALVIRANRLAGDVFLFLILFFAAGVFFLWASLTVSAVWMGLVAAAVGVGLAIIAVMFRSAFQRFFQEKILGMPLHPDRLVKEYSNRILTSLTTPGLINLLTGEILPSLLVRQSALLRLSARGEITTFMTLRVEAGQLPGAEQAAFLQERAGRMLAGEELPANLAWVRLVAPLRIGEQVSGLWLFGACDPDDYYTSSDIDTLTTLAAQTALALSHIDQANNLRALYLADGSRSETERLAFAAELHDAVLNPLAALRNGAFATQITPQFDEVLDETIQHVRQVVKGLRPDMLNYGLYLGLQSLVDDLEENSSGSPAIALEVSPSAVRLDPQVELNLFRIVQQACQNTIRHAEARKIRISGQIEADRVTLSAVDDGKGFAFNNQTDLAELLTHQHYGLAGMHERAEVIGANLEIVSRPGEGCRVRLAWAKK